MLPYKTIPVFLEKIWGGTRLINYYKNIEGKIGESIEFDGREHGIPLIIKLIDACDDLSIQVHPDEQTAVMFKDGTCGKDEFWVVLECYEDSYIYWGFNDSYDKKRIYEAALDGSIVNMLNKVDVSIGDCIYIPSGTVHALGKGVMVYELQQSSDVTYRLYDWDRLDKGKKRELHIEKAIESIKPHNFLSLSDITNIYEMESKGHNLLTIGNYKYFKAKFVSLKNEESIIQACDEVRIITAIYGHGFLDFKDNRMLLKKGDTVVLPKASDECVNIIGDGMLRYIEATV